jgi:cell division protease FtsH
MSKEDLLTRICTLTAGRAAEEVEFGVITTGASNDIEQATKLARAMITQYGMDDDFDMVAFDTRNNRYLDDSTTSSCSPATQEDIDRRVISIVKTQHEKAKELLRANMDKLNELSQYLYEKETITGEEFMRILNAPSKYKSLPDAQA